MVIGGDDQVWKPRRGRGDMRDHVDALQDIAAQLPSLALRPLRWAPESVLRRTVEPLLQHAFGALLARGDLAFLQGRYVGLQVVDVPLAWVFTVRGGRIRMVGAGLEPEVVIGGASALDLALLATGKADPDTLFFQRRLAIKGDTALGLELKNVLDGLDPDDVPVLVRLGLRRIGPWVARLDGFRESDGARP